MAFGLLLLFGVYESAAAADRKIPVPRLKPERVTAIPKPRLKPASESETVPMQKPITFPQIASGTGWPAKVIAAERRECAQRLKGKDIRFEPMAPLGRKNGCGAPAPIMVTHVAGVAILPPAEFTCDMAEAMYGWVAGSALPAAREHLNKKLTTINNASAYACRRRNNSKTGKLSEHAKANALDISTLGFDDGSTVSVKGHWSGLKQLVGMSAHGSFLRKIRRNACIRFTTVLGPGSDPFHGDHFHIDVSRRKNGYRICK